jgi:kynurenine formamidase
VVLFHTGWQALVETDPECFISGEPGLGLEGARYLAGIGARWMVINPVAVR